MTNTASTILQYTIPNICLFGLIYGLSCTVKLSDVKQQLTNTTALCIGVVLQFIVMPFLGYLSIQVFFNSANDAIAMAMGLMVLVVTSSPGGSYSNWWCGTFNADLALSVAMTTISSVLSIVFLPFNLVLYTHLCYNNDDESSSIVGALDVTALGVSLGIVLTAILTGLLTGTKYNHSKAFQTATSRLGTICGLVLILSSIVLGSSGGDEEENNNTTDSNTIPITSYIGIVFPCIVGLVFANFVCLSVSKKQQKSSPEGNALTKPEIVAIAIECCYQNTGIATSVAITMFPAGPVRSAAILVPLIYGGAEALFIGGYAVLAWKYGWTKAPAKEKVCVVVSTSYEGCSTDSNNTTDDEEMGTVKNSDGVIKDDDEKLRISNRKRFETEGTIDSSTISIVTTPLSYTGSSTDTLSPNMDTENTSDCTITPRRIQLNDEKNSDEETVQKCCRRTSSSILSDDGTVEDDTFSNEVRQNDVVRLQSLGHGNSSPQ